MGSVAGGAQYYSRRSGLWPAVTLDVGGRRRDASLLVWNKKTVAVVAPLERKNCWTIAEHVGHDSPHRLQHRLGRAVWDADGARDDVRSYVLGHLADPGAVLVVDETGRLERGTASVGVQRQYSGTAGRIENCQVAVFLTYAAPGGHAFVDRRLYLPESWSTDPDRRELAGVPDDVAFATTPALASQMIKSALMAGAPARWVAGDEVYGADPGSRITCRRLGLSYVLAIGKNRTVTTHAGTKRADEVIELIPARSVGAPVGRGRVQRAPLVLLGDRRHPARARRPRPRVRPPHPARAPQRHHRRAGLGTGAGPHAPVPVRDLVHVAGHRRPSRRTSRPPRATPG